MVFLDHQPMVLQTTITKDGARDSQAHNEDVLYENQGEASWSTMDTALIVCVKQHPRIRNAADRRIV